jgi:hypothetical protein
MKTPYRTPPIMQPTPFDRDKDAEQAWKDFVFHVGRAGLSAQQAVTLLNDLAETLTGEKKYGAELGPAPRCMILRAATNIVLFPRHRPMYGLKSQP